jgi:hypothetical protein
MSKGKRGVGLNKPCPKCGAEVPAFYKSPVQEGLCGKCTDEILRKRAPKPPAESRRLVQVVPGGGSTIIGFAIGFGLGVLLCLGLSAFAGGFWGNLTTGIRGLFG